jgi:hypothetical protein
VVSLIAQTGQSEAIRGLVDRRGLHGGDLMLA